MLESPFRRTDLKPNLFHAYKYNFDCLFLSTACNYTIIPTTKGGLQYSISPKTPCQLHKRLQ